jgi:hypothetical protein
MSLPCRSSRAASGQLVPLRRLGSGILVLRDQRVMLDETLAGLYEVQTRELIQSVKRNRERFPPDFMFQCTEKEFSCLRSQSVISKPEGRGGRRRAPYVFTEQGVAMLSSVLRSRRAILVNVEIMRAFARARRALQDYANLAKRLRALERRSDVRFKAVFDAIHVIMAPPPRPRRRIGFGPPSIS